MFKGKFKTAYDQRELPLDVAVVGTTNLHVGELVKYVAAASGKPAYIVAATGLSDATHIIAQSDMTMEYGHVPVENRDYKYSDVVAANVSATGSVTASTETKKVAVFAIKDINDVIVYEA